jgi:SAM-dependent methyltransferase
MSPGERPTAPSSILQRLAHEQAPLRRIVARLWRARTMRHLRPGDNHGALDHFYALPDPWDMASDREQGRFRYTNELIRQLAPGVGSVLEVGCGEGHQSLHLAGACRQLDGIDISSRAVQRAVTRVPDARFAVGEITALPWQTAPQGHYDLVVACEVLYYLNDIDSAIDAMSRLGRSCLVTFFAPAARRVADHLPVVDGLKRGWFHHAGQTWLWVWWSPAAARDPEGPDAQIGPASGKAPTDSRYLP